MNGHNIKVGNTSVNAEFTPVLFSDKANAILTINSNGGTIDMECRNNCGYIANIDGLTAKVIVNGVNYYGAPTVFQVTQGTLEVIDGYFDMGANKGEGTTYIADGYKVVSEVSGEDTLYKVVHIA